MLCHSDAKGGSAIARKRLPNCLGEKIRQLWQLFAFWLLLFVESANSPVKSDFHSRSTTMKPMHWRCAGWIVLESIQARTGMLQTSERGWCVHYVVERQRDTWPGPCFSTDNACRLCRLHFWRYLHDNATERGSLGIGRKEPRAGFLNLIHLRATSRTGLARVHR